MKNLTKVLERLKAEPEWCKAQIGIKGIISNSDAVRQHNATRARLLAAAEALEELGNAIDTAAQWGQLTDAKSAVVAKLVAALEKR